MKSPNGDIIFRDLTVLELTFLNNIKNNSLKLEMAGKAAVYEQDPSEISFALLMQIGSEAIENSVRCIDDDTTFELEVKEKRSMVERDSSLNAIKIINSVFPGQSITDLLNLTHKDLIELVCLCESIAGKPLFNVDGAKPKGRRLVNPKSLSPEMQKSLNECIADLNQLNR